VGRANQSLYITTKHYKRTTVWSTTIVVWELVIILLSRTLLTLWSLTQTELYSIIAIVGIVILIYNKFAIKFFLTKQNNYNCAQIILLFYHNYDIAAWL